MKKIFLDKKKCIGCYNCVHTCGQVFEVDSDGKARVRRGISEGDIMSAEGAGLNCPTGAIDIFDGNSSTNYDDDDMSFLGTVNSILNWAKSDE